MRCLFLSGGSRRRKRSCELWRRRRVRRRSWCWFVLAARKSLVRRRRWHRRENPKRRRKIRQQRRRRREVSLALRLEHITRWILRTRTFEKLLLSRMIGPMISLRRYFQYYEGILTRPKPRQRKCPEDMRGLAVVHPSARLGLRRRIQKDRTRLPGKTSSTFDLLA